MLNALPAPVSTMTRTALVALERPDRVVELGGHLEVERVHRLGTVERHGGDAVVDVDQQGLVRLHTRSFVAGSVNVNDG